MEGMADVKLPCDRPELDKVAASLGPLALMAMAACAFMLSSCAGGSNGAASASPKGERSATPEYEKRDRDRDTDFGVTIGDDTSHNRLVPSGHSASEPDRRSITTLVRRYYAAALAGDGARGCSLLYSPLAESVPSTYGSGPAGLPYAHGSTCETVLTNLFGHFHAQLAAEVPKLAVRRVLLYERHGAAVLGFGALPERQILVIREVDVWRVDALIDQELP
jgi:hypothetical protein